MSWGWSKSHYDSKKKIPPCEPVRAGYCIFLLLSYIDFSGGRAEAVSVPVSASLAIQGCAPAVNEAGAWADFPLLLDVRIVQSRKEQTAEQIGLAVNISAGDQWKHRGARQTGTLLQHYSKELFMFSAGPFNCHSFTLSLKLYCGLKLDHNNNSNNTFK